MPAVSRIASPLQSTDRDLRLRSETYAAPNADLATDEIVDVLFAVSAVVGIARVVSAAALVALALGLDLDESSTEA